MSEIKYPNVTVQLTGEDGNVYSIIARVNGAIRDTIGEDEARAYVGEAFRCPSYDALLALTMRTVTVI